MTGIAIGVTLFLSVAGGWRVALPWVGIVAALSLSRRGHKVFPFIGALFVAACIGSLRYQVAPAPSAFDWPSENEVIGTILNVPVLEGTTRHFLLETELPIETGGQVATVRLMVQAPARPETQLGDRIRVHGQADPIVDLSPGMAGYARSRDAVGTLRSSTVEILSAENSRWRTLAPVRQDVVRALRRALPGDGGALLAGFVTGDDSALSTDVDRAFRRTGTSHITAVSGANIALLVGLAVVLGSRAGWRRNWAWQLTTLATLWSYAALTGLNPPVVRAALLATGALAAVRFERRPDHLTLLALTAGGMVLIDPSQIRSLSFQLSFTAFFALLLALPLFPGNSWRSVLGMAVILPAVAHVATLPLLLGISGGFSLFSIPANILIAPAVSAAFPLALLTATVGVIFPAGAEVLGGVAEILTWYIINVVVWLDARGATVAVSVPGRLGQFLLWGCTLGALWAMSSEGRRTWRHFILDSAESSRRTAMLLLATGCGAAVTAIWVSGR